MGVETYNAKTKETFNLYANLLWIVSDIRTLKLLSRWNIEGSWVSPTYNYDVFSQYLKHIDKMCYLDQQRFFPPDHPYRNDKKSFDGKEEHKYMPTALSGEQIL